MLKEDRKERTVQANIAERLPPTIYPFEFLLQLGKLCSHPRGPGRYTCPSRIAVPGADLGKHLWESGHPGGFEVGDRRVESWDVQTERLHLPGRLAFQMDS